MELSLICPVKHTEWTKLLPGRFCIAPVALKHPEYRAYFTNAGIDGYNVILDNGIFEDDKVRDPVYIELAAHIKPRVLICPDTINAGAKENLDESNKFAELVKATRLDEALPEPIELMHVIQCEKGDDHGFWRVLGDILVEDTYQWIGICRDALFNAFSQFTHTEDQELNRFFFAAQLFISFPGKEGQAQILNKKWHFLGMGNRLDLLRFYWFVDSMDTASLFHQSTLGNMISGAYIMPGVLKRPTDYFVRDFGPEGCWLDALQHNCNEAQKVAQQAGANRRRILGGRL